MEHPLKPPQDPQNFDHSGHPNTDSEAKTPNITLWILTGIIVAALLVVLLVLPKMVAETENKPQVNTKEKPQEKPQPPIVAEQASNPETEAPAANQTSVNAEQALQSYLRLRAQPKLANADIWAANDWAMAATTAAVGDRAFGEQKFSTAVMKYKEAVNQLQTILDDRDETQLKYLSSGWKFLTDNALGDAGHAFRRVLLMQPDHQQAQRGLQQAAARRQVLKLMLSGQQAEITDNLKQAAEAYSAALQLDPYYITAEEGLNRVTTELQRRAFQDAMGQALLNLDKGKFSAAGKALQQAAAIYPDDESLRQATQRLLTDRRQASLNSLRSQSTQLVGKEEWTNAAAKYRKALAIDPKAAFARNGLAKATDKIKLHQQLDHYLADPSRLYSNDPLDNAQQLLAGNPDLPAAEPRLAAKLVSLKRAVKLAITPVDLLITSDNLTEISIYKVGRQGVFMQKQFSLKPGKYTIAGARKGYRDVLKVMDLKPTISGQRINIRTEEEF
ncbi:MAG: hypothetical protein L3J22_05365 [Xanthomonadales bacterium]|nr:hypothetical protein [Xanthomonadales bacterium]